MDDRVFIRGLATGMVSVFLSGVAAAAAPLNVRGTIAEVSGDTIAIKERDGTAQTIHLAQNAKVASVAPASVSDIKPGSYIGTAAMPQPDGTLKALEIHIFPSSMRGTGEGSRPWDLGANSSMTNGTIAHEVENVSGNRLTVHYRGGEKVVAVGPDTKVVELAAAQRTDLKPGERIFVPGATRNPDGSLEASRVTVGKDGVAPPM
jgi:hypothetical protein